MIDKSTLVQKLAQKVAKTDTCGVKGCESTENVTLVTLKPFDPIDHDEKFVALCAHHQFWADERNDFAEQMADELRAKRKEIGQENIETIQELAMPQETAREDLLMGEVEGGVELEEAFDGDSLFDEKRKSKLLTGGEE